MSLWIAFLNKLTFFIKINKIVLLQGLSKMKDLFNLKIKPPMKKHALIIILFLIVSSLNAQISNLTELATGELEIFTPITELNGELFGYFTIFKLDDVSKTEEKFEYVLLDKNLNKVSNGEFIDTKYRKFFSEFLYPQKIDNHIIFSKLLLYEGPLVYTAFTPSTAKFTFSSHRMLDLKTNKVSSPFYFEKGELIEGDRSAKKNKETG